MGGQSQNSKEIFDKIGKILGDAVDAVHAANKILPEDDRIALVTALVRHSHKEADDCNYEGQFAFAGAKNDTGAAFECMMHEPQVAEVMKEVVMKNTISKMLESLKGEKKTKNEWSK